MEEKRFVSSRKFGDEFVILCCVAFDGLILCGFGALHLRSSKDLAV